MRRVESYSVIADAARCTVRLGPTAWVDAPDMAGRWVKHMADIINLNQYRKARARAEKERLAQQSRVRHGETRTTKDAVRREEELQLLELDGKLLQIKAPIPEPT